MAESTNYGDARLIDQLPKSFTEFRVMVTVYNGNVYDISENIIEISIYESIYVPFLYGEIYIGDNSTMLSAYPFIGQEKIRVEWVRDGKKLIRDFWVTDVFDLHKAVENTGTYGLSISSEKQILNAVNLFSKSYSGRGDKIIKDIHDEYLNGDLEVLVPGKTSHNVVFPYMKPLQAIDMVRKNVLGADDSPLFMFETLYGERTRLDSYRRMMESDSVYEINPTVTANSNEDGESSRTLLENRGQVYNYMISKAYDTLENLSSGSYSSFSTVVDPVNKYGVRTDFDFVRHAPPVANTQISDFYTINGRRMNRLYQTRNIVVPQNINAFEDGFPNLNGVTELDKSILNAYSQRMKTVNVTVHMDSVHLPDPSDEDTVFEVGRSVNYIMPKFAPKLDEDKNKDNEDQVNSGKYIISAMRHRLKREEYTMSIEMIRDGMGEDAELKENNEPPNFDTEPVFRQSILPEIN